MLKQNIIFLLVCLLFFNLGEGNAHLRSNRNLTGEVEEGESSVVYISTSFAKIGSNTLQFYTSGTSGIILSSITKVELINKFDGTLKSLCKEEVSECSAFSTDTATITVKDSEGIDQKEEKEVISIQIENMMISGK